MRILSCVVEQHDLLLVLLAAAICLVGSLVTTRLYLKSRHARGRAKASWLFMGAVAGGATIWCTHFVAMLAYRPGVDVTYEPALTGLSLLVAIMGCAVALFLGSGTRRRAPEAGGVVFGLSVAIMHYLGMAAFTADAVVVWSPVYVVASVVAAVAGGAIAFHVAARVKTRRGLAWATLALVLTIVSLHFTGMGALTVLPLAPAAGRLTGDDASSLLAVGVAAVAFLLLGIALASQSLEAQARAMFRNRLNSLIEGSVDGMVVESEGRIVMANAAFVALCGVEASRIIDTPIDRWIDDVQRTAGDALLSTRMAADAEGVAAPVEVAVRREIDPGEQREVRVFAVRDLRPRLAQERRIAHMARNDSLTGLPNRSSFLEKLSRVAVSGGDAPFALMAIDLDRFKEVNDLYGHAVGDQLLSHVAARMSEVLRAGEFVARLGGDEFVALIPAADRDEALKAAERLRDAIITPIRADHADIRCGASIGIALWPQDAAETSVLANNADLAMYRVKAMLTADICFYEGAMDEAVRRRRRLTQGMREALEQDHFELHYQVQTSVETGAVTGFEALLRWPQPEGGYISPADFIPLAEETGVILPIGEWVLRRACAEAAKWPEPHRIAVNLSPVQLSNIDLPRLVHQVLIETGLSPSRLELEITETAMISDMERTTHVLRQLKLLGVSVAMDDFGTGYSSLSTLRAFPFDKIKLDRTFMAELDGGPQSAAIIRAVLALGESLAIPILAEGVETVEQLEFLRKQGCDEAQGFLLGRPSREACAPAVPALAISAA